MRQRILSTYTKVRPWFPVTDLGALVLVGSVMSLWFYAFPRQDYVAQVISSALIVMEVVALLVVGVGGYLWYRWAHTYLFSQEAIQFEAHRGFRNGERFPRTRVPLLVVRTKVVSPPGLRLDTERGIEQFTAEHRTAGSQVVRKTVVEDCFGLARVQFEAGSRQPVRVCPWLGEIERAPHLTALAPGESQAHPFGRPLGDKVELRRYVRGDPIRLVLWKVYARTGQLMVRTAETARDEDTDVYAYLVTGTGDEASAAIAWVAVSRRLLGPKWHFGTDRLPNGTSDISAAEAAIARSHPNVALAEAEGAPLDTGEGLRTFLAGTSPESGARVVVFVPCMPGEWIEPVKAGCLRFQGRLTVVVGFDAVRASSQHSWFRRGDEASPEACTASPEQLQTIEEAFRPLAAELVVIDRVSGRRHDGMVTAPRGVA
ncbi:MAG: DUF58 domain-containing protein [Myxococcales bacterium]|nr:DUF58 domain-containing protein [Myxococcales bacterium]